ACEAFRGPFRGGINSHFRAEIGHPAGMVQRVDWSHCELDITLGINVVQRFPRYFGDILDVDILIDYDNTLAEHRLTEAPNGVHDFPGLAWIRFANRNQHQIVK